MRFHPDRNQMSSLVAVEMRYFNRPTSKAWLTFFTWILALAGLFLTVIRYVSGSDSTDYYIRLSGGLIIALLLLSLLYKILRAKNTTFRLMMVFTGLTFVAAAFGGFLLTRLIWADALERSMLGGLAYYYENVMHWFFWFPIGLFLMYMLLIFIPASHPNADGGYWYILHVCSPLLIIVVTAGVLQIDLSKEQLLNVASVAATAWLSFILSLAVRYITKAIIHVMLVNMPNDEEVVVIQSTIAGRDGRRVQWREKREPVVESVPAANAASARFTNWLKNLFSPSVPESLRENHPLQPQFTIQKSTSPIEPISVDGVTQQHIASDAAVQTASPTPVVAAQQQDPSSAGFLERIFRTRMEAATAEQNTDSATLVKPEYEHVGIAFVSDTTADYNQTIAIDKQDPALASQIVISGETTIQSGEKQPVITAFSAEVSDVAVTETIPATRTQQEQQAARETAVPDRATEILVSEETRSSEEIAAQDIVAASSAEPVHDVQVFKSAGASLHFYKAPEMLLTVVKAALEEPARSENASPDRKPVIDRVSVILQILNRADRTKVGPAVLDVHDRPARETAEASGIFKEQPVQLSLGDEQTHKEIPTTPEQVIVAQDSSATVQHQPMMTAFIDKESLTVATIEETPHISVPNIHVAMLDTVSVNVDGADQKAALAQKPDSEISDRYAAEQEPMIAAVTSEQKIEESAQVTRSHPAIPVALPPVSAPSSVPRVTAAAQAAAPDTLPPRTVPPTGAIPRESAHTSRTAERYPEGFCGRCGNKLGAGTRFCNKCGYKRIQLNSEKTAERRYAGYCIKCGNHLVEGANFCNTCGFRWSLRNSGNTQLTVFCGKCGYKLKSNARFCSHCGAKVTFAATGRGESKRVGANTK